MPLTEEQIQDLINPTTALDILPQKIANLTAMIEENALDYDIIAGLENRDVAELKLIATRIANLMTARTAYEDRLAAINLAAKGTSSIPRRERLEKAR